MQGYKHGANVADINRIRLAFESGESACETANRLRIMLFVVESFYKYFKCKKPKSQTGVKRTKIN